MRYAFYVALLMFCFASLSANLERNQPFEQVQPDGTKLALFVTGDEFYRRVHDADDYSIVLDPESGYAVYALPEGNGIKPSAYRVGTIDPATLGIQPGLMQDPAITRQRINSHNAALGTDETRAPSTGTINNIFIFCRFADQSEYTQALSIYSNMCNSTTSASMKGYFQEESNNQLTINTTFYPAAVGGIVRSYQDSHNRSYFLPYNASTNPGGYPPGPTNDPDYYGYVRLQTMLRAAVVSVSGSIPAGLNVDGDTDGNVDNVTFVCQGATGGWGDPLWPHHWTLHLPSAVYINSKRVWDYNMQLSSTIDIGVISHEMSHSMGYPDLYHYSSSSTIDPVGAWDLMEWDQDIPQHHLTHMKRKYGEWFATVPTITPSSTPTQYTLTAIDQSPFSCYKINSTLANEYYMLEYRRKTGTYENSIPATGLIIYRIISTYDGDTLNGNAGGPPDEVYIYRPNGTISVNGSINSANYSSTVGRTAIHDYTNPEPWLYSSTGTSLDGNLVITDIGASGGTTITFKVSNTPPNVWDGSTSTAWGTASNWSKGTVPTNTEYVEIPDGCPRYPYVSTTTPTCKQLTVQSGASVTISNGTLNVMNDVDIYGTLIMNNSAGNLYVGEDLLFESGSTATVIADAEIYVSSDVEFLAGCNVNMTNGYLDFSGTGTSYIRCYEPTTINHLRSHKNGASFGISAASTATLTINGSWYTYNGSTSTHPESGTTILKGGLYVYTGGQVNFASGTISFEGSSSSSIFFEDPGSYFRNLTVNKTGTSVFLSEAAEVKGNLTIQSGTLNPASNTLTLGGNWTNNVGPTAFTEGTGTVILNGTGTQTMTTENFYTLELNKGGGIMSIPSGVTVTCQNYDWTAGAYTVSGGTFTVDDLVDPGILGTITLSSGTINYTQDSGNYIDLRADLTISGGTFNAWGGNSNAWFSYIDVATLTLSGSGVLDFKNQGIYISSGYAFNDNISGGTIKTYQGFNVQRADFNPTGGTIELYGSTDCNLTNTAGSNFHNVTINKAATREEEGRSLPDYTLDREGNRIPLTRTNTVSGIGPIDINGIFRIQAGMFVAPEDMTVAGNWQNVVGPTAFTEGAGTVTLDGGGHQYCNYSEDFNNLVINKSGGALRVNNSSAVVTCASYSWTAGAVDVNVGTFTASDLAQNGIYGNFYVNPGGTINLHQGDDQWIDLNGFFYLTGGGTINVYGGSMSCYLAYYADAGIIQSGGDIWFRDRGLVATSTAHDLTLNVTGGFIRVKGGLSDTRGGLVFANGTVEFYGPGVNNVSLGAGSRFYNLRIEKTDTRTPGVRSEVQTIGSHGRFETLDFRENSIKAFSDLQVNGSLTVSTGIFDVNSNTITVYNDLNVWSTLKMITSTGMLDIWDDVNWQPTGMSNVTAGTIHCGGNWFFANGCSVDLTGSTSRMDAYYGGNITNNSSTANFGNLEIYGTEEEPEFDYIYSLGTNHLLVAGDLTVYPENTLNLNEGVCTVSGNAEIQATGAVDIGDGGTFTVNGNLDLHGGLVTGPGSAIVHGLFNTFSTGNLSVNQGSFVNDAPWADPWVVSLNGAVNITNGVFEITNKTLTIAAHATRVFYNATVRVGVGFTATASSCFQPTGTGGGLYQIGTGNPVLEVTGNNFLMNYFVQKGSSTDTVYLQDDIVIKGNVTITSGKLNGNNYNLTVGGNWANNVGTAAFLPGTGAVLFNKAGSLQSVTGSTNFASVIDNHTGAALDFQGATGISGTLTVNSIVTFQNVATLGTVTNTPSAAILAFYGSHTSTIASYTGGGAIRSFNAGNHVTIADLAQNGLYGAWTADAGHLEVHQDAGSWIDLNGTLNILNNGILDLYGGSMSCYLAYSADTAINMASGEFNIMDRGLTATASGHALSLNVTGGVIRLAGGFSDTRGGLVFAGGVIEFVGGGDVTAMQSAGSSFHDVEINKTGGTRTGELDGVQTIGSHGRFETIDLRANSVSASSDLQITGDLTITNGTFNVNGHIVYVVGDVLNYGILKMTTAGSKIMSGDDFYWYNTSVADITMGEIDCGASWFVYNGATVVLPPAVVTKLTSTLAKTVYLNSPGTQFGDLSVGGTSAGSGYTISISSGQDLVVTGDLAITANNELDLNNRNLNLTGNLILNGKLDIHATTATLQGKPVTSSGSILAIDSGTLIYYSSTIPRTTDLWGTLNINSGTYHAVNNSIAIRSGSANTIASGWLIATSINATHAGTFQPAGGTVKVVSNLAGGYSTFTVSNGNWVPNFILDTNTGISLGADLLVKGNLTITNGSFDVTASNYALTVGGDWANNAGVANFIARNGTVTFNQNGGVQTVSGANAFFNVMDSHVGAALDFQGAATVNGLLTVNNIVTFHNQATLNTVMNSGPTAILAFYNAFTSTIASYNGDGAIRSFDAGNHVIIADLYQSGLYGSWTADAGHLEVHQDSGSWIDLNGDVSILNNGVLDIYGGSMSTFMSFNHDASLTMTSGEFNVKDWGIRIDDSIFNCTFNISGGTITANGYFNDQRGVFNPTGGTVKFEGSNDAWVILQATSAFHHVLVDKVVTRDGSEPLIEVDREGNAATVNRSGILALNSPLTVNGNFTVQNANLVTLNYNLNCLNAGTIAINAGTLDLNGNELNSSGNIDVYGTLRLTPASILRLSNNKGVFVHSGGLLESLGDSTDNVLFTRNGASGYYGVVVQNGGTISAAHTLFEYAGANGVTVHSLALVDAVNSFNHCTFRQSPANGILLTINNSQTLTIDGATFPANTWGGVYNVSKTANQGNLTFTNFSGDFSGSAYEEDPYGRINWSAGGVPEISNLSIERSGASDIRLYWTYPHPYDSFKIYACDTPDGTFVLAGTTTNLYWTGSTTNVRAFYRVTVVYEP